MSYSDRLNDLLADVVGWAPHVGADGWTVQAVFWPTAQLEVAGRSSELFVGNVPGRDDAPPDHAAADEATLRDGIAGRGSEFDPVHAVFLDVPRRWPPAAAGP
jgi:hypothetical protein